ncbi:FtsQ-type POTRA domain-containing protein [Brachybacterium sp. GPGPB12]|uniref:cell division protein FtsQ/DivIB n=1 Tax=Brachybacterium sp. GPGPB12 TaxID=3023517 RepID=UPI0031345DB7
MRPGRAAPTGRSAAPAPSARAARSAPSAHSATSPSPAPRASRGRGLGRPAVEPEAPLAPPRTQEEEPGGGRIVQAADRFRELVAGRPWRRRRRAIIAGTLVTALVLVAALATAVMLPTLQVRDITVEGTGYVAEEDVREAVASHSGDSVSLSPTRDIADRAAEVPGVATAEVDRVWPDGMTVTVTEAAPVARLTRADGGTAVVDAAGEELPAAAGEGATLVPMTVQGGAADPEGAAATMSEVLASLPDPRAARSGRSPPPAPATSPSSSPSRTAAPRRSSGATRTMQSSRPRWCRRRWADPARPSTSPPRSHPSPADLLRCDAGLRAPGAGRGRAGGHPADRRIGRTGR